MRKQGIAGIIVLGSVVMAACNDNPVGMDQADTMSSIDAGSTPSEMGPAPTGGPSLALSAGETFSYITIDDPTGSTYSMAPGSTKQMLGTLHYSAGGTLPAAPYASWRSSDNCIATVTNASPNWGKVTGVASGTAKIIAETWGKADTVTVTVTGSTAPSASCYASEWSWNYNDVSFTGTPLPSTSWYVAAGEKLVKVVLFAGPKPDYTIDRGLKVTLKSEMWYDQGGKIGGKGYVSFLVTDGSVASINAKGVVTGLKSGRTKVIAKLGTFADTVPLYVR